MATRSFAIKFSPWLGMGLLISANNALSMGLGELKHTSMLGQTFRAELELLSHENLDMREIRISHATKKEANEMGVEIVYSHTDLRFELIEKDGVISHAKVRSRRPIIEPYINLFIKLETPSGSVYREYAVLLDLPATRRTKTKPQENALSDQKQALNNKKLSPKPHSEAQIALGNHYRVHAGDSLSSIVAKIASHEASPDHMMKVIFAQNPHAFINGDINLIKLGADISIPSHFKAVEWDKVQIAEHETDSQNDKANEIESTPSNQVQKRGRLRLRTLTDDKSTTYAEKIQSKIDIANESLDKINKENQELREQIARIEKSTFMKTAIKLLTLQRKRIEQLQTQLQVSETEQLAESPSSLSGLFISQANATEYSGRSSFLNSNFQNTERPTPKSKPSILVSVIAAFIMLAAFAVTYRLFDILNKKLRSKFKHLFYIGGSQTEQAPASPNEFLTANVDKNDTALVQDEFEISYRYRGSKFQPGNGIDQVLKQRVIEKTQQYRDELSQKRIDENRAMELTIHANLDEAIKELLIIVDQYLSNGKVAEARAVLLAQNHIMPDPRLDEALNKIGRTENPSSMRVYEGKS